YGYEPWLLESFVDQDKYRGTCFQAANWERIGQSKGRGRNDRANQSPESIKDIYVYPLAADFRRRMGVTVERGGNLRALAVEEGLGSGEWAKQEFGGVELGDKRLRNRLINIVEDRSDHPDASYLEAAGGDRYAAKGYYTFIDNPRETLNPEAMLSTHRKRTIERMMSHKLALVVQDTTDLNFSKRPHTEGLGLVGTNQTGAQASFVCGLDPGRAAAGGFAGDDVRAGEKGKGGQKEYRASDRREEVVPLAGRISGLRGGSQEDAEDAPAHGDGSGRRYFRVV